MNLDERTDQGVNKQWLDELSDKEAVNLKGSSDVYPYVRNSGLKLNIDVQFYNFGLKESEFDGLDKEDMKESFTSIFEDKPTVCVLTVHVSPIWTSLGNSFGRIDTTTTNYTRSLDEQRILINEYEYGIMIELAAVGTLGRFEIIYFMEILVEFLVLMEACSLFTSFIARHLMGPSSLLYRNIMDEHADILTQYARFAAKAITASLVFDIVDGNANGEVSKGELFKELRSVFYSHMTYDETVTLVEFMMFMAESLARPLDRGTSDQADTKKARGSFLLGPGSDSLSPRRQKAMAIEHGIPKENSRRSRTHLSREDWLNVFIGPPSTVSRDYFLKIRRKQLLARGDASVDMANYEKIDDEITMRQSMQLGAPPPELRCARASPESTKTDAEMGAFVFDNSKAVNIEVAPELELLEVKKGVYPAELPIESNGVEEDEVAHTGGARESLIPINIRGEDVQRELWTKHARAIYSLQHQVRLVNEKYERAMDDLRKERAKSQTVWEVTTELASDVMFLKQRSEDPSGNEERWYKKILPTMYQKTVGALQDSLHKPTFEENALYGVDAAIDLESDILPLAQKQEPKRQEPQQPQKQDLDPETSTFQHQPSEYASSLHSFGQEIPTLQLNSNMDELLITKEDTDSPYDTMPEFQEWEPLPPLSPSAQSSFC